MSSLQRGMISIRIACFIFATLFLRSCDMTRSPPGARQRTSNSLPSALPNLPCAGKEPRM
eukprot:757950-Hanusia_phi.AAC.4